MAPYKGPEDRIIKLAAPQPTGNPDPQDVFKQAEILRVTAAIMNMTAGRGYWHLLPVVVVNSALSVELYFKCLLLLESGGKHAGWGHDLKKLFTKLSPDTQKNFRDRYEAEIVGKLPGQESFDADLDNSSQAFEQSRYYHEGGARGWAASPLREFARQRILAIRPEWNDIKYDSPDGLIAPNPEDLSVPRP